MKAIMFALACSITLGACHPEVESSGAECRPCDPEKVPCAQRQECDDGDPLTADRCAAVTAGCEKAACVHPAVECDHCAPADEQQAVCADADACTADRCDDASECVHGPVAGCP